MFFNFFDGKAMIWTEMYFYTIKKLVLFELLENSQSIASLNGNIEAEKPTTCHLTSM